MMENNLRDVSYIAKSSTINDLADLGSNGASGDFLGGIPEVNLESQTNSDQKIMEVPVARLAAYCNPFEIDIWGCGLVTPAMVGAAIATDTYIGHLQWKHVYDWTATDHARRIACLVVAGWGDPIKLYVSMLNISRQPPYIVQDGNHRLAAAIYRGQEFIKAEVSGSLEYMQDLFGISHI